jgi:hypothetical protein
MNLLLLSSLLFAKIIKALLYPKKFLTLYLDYIGRNFLEKKAAERNGLIVGNG